MPERWQAREPQRAEASESAQAEVQALQAWKLTRTQNGTQAGQPGEQIVTLLSAFLTDRNNFIGTPTELSQKIDPDGQEGITPKKVARLILQSVDTLRKNRISAVIRSPGARMGMPGG